MNLHRAAMRAALALAFAATQGHLGAQAPGLRLFQPIGNFATQLLDASGTVVHQWPGGGNLTAHVAADGSLLRGRQATAIPVPGQTGGVQRIDFDGTVRWDYPLSGPHLFGHHDLEPMPNGNVLVIVWERYTIADAIAQGRDPALLTGTDWLPDGLIELQPTGPSSAVVVWEWHLIDHVVQDYDATKPNFGVVADHPELLDINYPPVVLTDGDYNHANGIDYDPVHDLIAISARAQNEVYIIDHATTTAEAAGHTGGARGRGGDILWRWGNPAAYGAGTAQDQQLDGQHDPRFVPPGYPGAGHLTLFNNRHTPTASAVYELALPMDAAGNLAIDPVLGTYGPPAPLWTFTEPGFFSNVTSSAERLPNGNTLICSGTQNRVFEVTPAGQTVMSYVHPGSNLLFQANYVDRSMWADRASLSIAGDQVRFDHLTGTAHANRYALLLGTLSGRSPGAALPGGTVLPLNVDALTDAMATQWNTGVFVDTLCVLDGAGAGASAVLAPPGVIPPALVGVTLDFAHVVFDAGLQPVRAGTAVSVTISP